MSRGRGQRFNRRGQGMPQGRAYQFSGKRSGRGMSMGQGRGMGRQQGMRQGQGYRWQMNTTTDDISLDETTSTTVNNTNWRNYFNSWFRGFRFFRR